MRLGRLRRDVVGLVWPETARVDLDPSAERRLRGEQIARTAQQLIVNFIANPLCVAAVAAVYWAREPGVVVLGWVAYSQLANGFGVALAWLYRRRPAAFTSDGWERLFCLFALADSLIWGAAPWLFLDPAEPLYTLFLGGVLLGVAAGAQLAYVSLLRAAAIFTVVSMASLALRLAILDEAIYGVLSLLIGLYLGLVLLIAVHLNTALKNAWRLRLAYEQADQRLAFALDAAGVATWELDNASGEMRVGGAFAKLFGLRPNVPASSLSEWRSRIHPDDRRLLTDTDHALTAGGDAFTMRQRMMTEDGGYRWFETRGRVRERGGDGRPLRVAGVHTDVTDLKLAQERAEAASQAKSEFLSAMSHELRTPLNSVLGYAQLLEMGEAEPLTHDERRQYIDQILVAGRHLLTLIEDILDLSKIESGRLDFAVEAVAVDPLIEECLRQMGDPARRHGITLAHDRAAGDVAVRADPTRLRQVLLNLLSNAAKYNRKNGTVTVSVVWRNPALVRIAVTDTGIGIPEERRRELFTPFARLGQEAGSIAGTGIGLAISRRLVELMEGAMGFTPGDGGGSTFWVELLPAYQDRGSPDAAAAEC